MHFGAILPHYGLDSNPDVIRRVAELAEELGFDSVWATERFTERIGLGTSIVLVPLHHPMHLAKEGATLRDFEGEFWSFHDATAEPHRRHPDLRVFPRTRPELVDEMLGAGAEGAVVQFPDETAMREFAQRFG